MGILDTIASPILGIVNKFVPDADKKLEATQQIYSILANEDLAQMEVNKVEAASKSMLVAGWRPFIGWTCGVGLAYATIGQNIMQWACAIWWPDVTPPVVDTALLVPILMGMLGMGGMRTMEKLKGVAREK